MTRCPECSQVLGRDEDHTPAFSLPPTLSRFEHFLATKGLLGRSLGAVDVQLPMRSHDVPAKPITSVKHRYSCVSALVSALTEIGYLEKGEKAGRWNSIEGKVLRDLSSPEIRDYLRRRFPMDPCQQHTDDCRRCCMPHHLSMFNKTCEAFRKMAEWLYFEEGRQGGGSAWSKEKLVEVYGISRTVRYKVAPPTMNDVDRVLEFRAWLGTKAPPPSYRGEARKGARARALALYAETGSMKEVSRRLKLPLTTVWSWVQGRRESEAVPEAIRREMPRSYAWNLFFLQETGARYEEMVHAEFPLEGPYVRWDKSAGTLTIIGKGREGGKLRTVTLTKEQNGRFGELVAWRTRLTKLLRDRTGHDPAPRLFVTLSTSTKASGNPLSETAGPWNETLKTWARRYNDWCEKNDRKDRAIDPDLCTSHKIGRAVSITKLAREGVPERVLMLERGIEDHNTVERYIRFSTEDRRSMLEAAEKSLARRSNGTAGSDPHGEDAGSFDVKSGRESGNVNRAVLEELRALRETVDELRGELREKDKRIAELTDRILAPAR